MHSIISEVLFPFNGSEDRKVGPYIPTFYQFCDTISPCDSSDVSLTSTLTREPVNPFTQEPLYAGTPLRRNPFTLEPLYSGTPLLRNPFTQEPLYSGTPLLRNPFTLEPLYSGTPLLRNPFTLLILILHPYRMTSCSSHWLISTSSLSLRISSLPSLVFQISSGHHKKSQWYEHFKIKANFCSFCSFSFPPHLQ